MQAANANAPKILEALITLGRAEAKDVRFALLGLPPHLQSAVMKTMAPLQEVALQIVQLQKARDVR
eukprot:3381080-Prymnesium_polylepis.1